MTRPRGHRSLGWLLVVLVGLLAVPAFASAHATLIQTSPEDGEVVPATPKRITLTFNEPIEASLGSIRVFDGDIKEVKVATPVKAGTDAVATTIAATLARGTYTVSWRVLSADGHPLDGSFVFHVGAPGANPAGVGSRVKPQVSGALKRASDVARFLNITLVIALIGGVIALLALFAGRDGDVERRMWHVVAGVGFGLSITAGATVLLEAAIVNGAGVSAAAQGDVLSAVLKTRFGHVRLAQLILSEVIAISAVWAATVRSRGFKWTIGIMAAGLSLTPGLSGHAGVNGPLAVVADTGHVLAASAWVGGLASIAIGMLLAGRGNRRAFAQGVFPRFSTIALISVGVLLVAGTIGSLENVDRFNELWTTTYGKLLLTKMGIALVLIGLGAFSRLAVRRIRDADGSGLARLRQTVSAEIGLMLVAIAVTSVLISKPPAKASGAQQASQATRTVTIADLTARLTVTPARTGENALRIELTKGGSPVTVDEVSLTAAPAGGAIAPFKLAATSTGAGRWVAGPLQASAAGQWTIGIAVRRGDFDQKDGTATVTIRKAS